MRSSPPEPAKEIDAALTLEIAATPKQFVYNVEEVRRVADVTIVRVDLDSSDAKGLDETLEGSAAWWAGPPKGYADVLSVDPERECVNLRFVTPQPPSIGEKLFIYPPQYLEALRDWWRISANADLAIRWFERIEHGGTKSTTGPLADSLFAWLRQAQRRAFSLPSWDCSFLEGPPGTGKTTTLGCVLASYLVQHPDHRILLLSTTNNAVDLALVSVDKALERFPRAGWEHRSKCKRLGHHYHARNYDARTHLLPSPDPELVKQLAQLESKRPESQDVVAYAAWKKQVEQLRAKLKTNLEAVLRSSRLAAITTCSAMFWTSALYQCAPFDLVVFDEASQVALAYAIALSTLGKRVLFAGDPAQLAPIVQSEHRQPRKWIGRSAFDGISPAAGASVFLEEQSRMHAEICRVVSDLFYRRKLRVAEKESADLGWQAHRKLVHRRDDLRRHVHTITVPASSTWSHKYHGPIRFVSAQAVAELVTEIVRSEDAESVLVLTPFRAQRTLLRSMLGSTHRKVTVSTVHKAQGTERRTVIFDPVDGSSSFLLGDEARRLVNVALSRAEARLVLLLSEADRQNPLFAHPAFGSPSGGSGGTQRQNHLPHGTSESRTPAPAEPIQSYINNPAFPRCLKGKRIKYKEIIGMVTDVSAGRITIEPDAGPVVIYSAEFIKSMFARTPNRTSAPRQANQDWPQRECKNCGGSIRLVKTATGWRPYELSDFRPHRCF